MKARPVETGVTAPVEQVHEEIEEMLEGPVGEAPVRMKPVLLTVQKQYKQSGQLMTDPDEDSEEITVQGFHVEPALASMRVNHTVNLGNYWSLSVQVGMEVPCYREEYADAMGFIAETVGTRLGIEIERGKERVSAMRGQAHTPSSGSGRSPGKSHPF